MTQNGNAIVMILIAIALFAALGFAFSNTSRTSSSFITDAEAEAYTNKIISYGNDIKSAVKRAQLSGCDLLDISFENDVVAGYTNGNNPPEECKIFKNGVQYIRPNIAWLDTSSAGGPPPELFKEIYFPELSSFLIGMGEPSGGAFNIEGKEVLMIIPHIKKDLCLKINDVLGVANIGSDPPGEAGSTWSAGNSKFDGVGTIGNSQINLSGASGNVKQVCFEGDGATDALSNTYYYMHVLVVQ